MAMKANKLQWQKRAKRNSAGNRVWYTTCGRYMVHESAVCYGVKFPGVRYTAWELRRARDRHIYFTYWRVVSRHRKRGAAEQSCDKTNRKRLRSE